MILNTPICTTVDYVGINDYFEWMINQKLIERKIIPVNEGYVSNIDHLWICPRLISPVIGKVPDYKCILSLQFRKEWVNYPRVRGGCMW